MIKLKSFLVNLFIPLAIGFLSGFLTMNSTEIYKNLELPKLSPPSVLFPIVWAILYVLMGISAYLIYESTSSNKQKALTIYGVQLAMNFIWPLIFFNSQLYLFAFLWLLALWFLVLWMIVEFYKIKPIAAYLQIPYLLWLTFAGYLNFMIYLLN